MGDLANELFRMLKAKPSAPRHHPGKLVLVFCLLLVIAFGVILRLLIL